MNRAGVDAIIETSPDTLLTVSQGSPLPQKGNGVIRVPVNLRIGSRELTTGSGTRAYNVNDDDYMYRYELTKYTIIGMVLRPRNDHQNTASNLPDRLVRLKGLKLVGLVVGLWTNITLGRAPKKNSTEL